MGNYLLSVAGLSAAGSLFMNGDASEPGTWAYLALAAFAMVMAGRAFARGVFENEVSAPRRLSERRSAPAR